MAAGAVAGAAVAGAIATAASSLGQTIINNAINWKIAQENRNVQRETNSQNEALMREAWARDDTARQRMVVDLENAGLSKWLATGASPMSSSPISLTAPQNDYKADFNFGSAMDKALAAYQNVQYIAQTEAQTKNLQDQNNLLAEQIKEAAARASVAAHDAEIFLRRDSASTDPAVMKEIFEVVNQLENPDSKLRSFLKSTFGWDFNQVSTQSDYWQKKQEEWDAAREAKAAEKQRKKEEKEKLKQERKENASKEKVAKEKAVEKATVQPRSATVQQYKQNFWKKITHPFGF